jgi:hypothetical protein
MDHCSPSTERAFEGLPAGRAIVDLQPFIHVEKPLFTAKPVPLTDKADHDYSHCHQPERGFGAILIPVDLFTDGVLGIGAF